MRARQGSADELGDAALATHLEAVGQGMKVTANGTCYGSAIEMNVIEHRKRVWVTVYLPDGGSYRTRVARTEKPGSWFNPLQVQHGLPVAIIGHGVRTRFFTTEDPIGKPLKVGSIWVTVGGVLAVANIRGGGEYGKDWHEGGKKLTARTGCTCDAYMSDSSSRRKKPPSSRRACTWP